MIEIADVALAGPRADELIGGHIDRPHAGDRVEAQAIEVAGWALGRERPAVAVELWCEGRLARRAPLNRPRPDLAQAFSDAPGAGAAGFRTTVSAFGRDPSMEIEVRAVLADQRRVPLARILGRRRWREGPEAGAPLVSVVIPCYGQAHYLTEAIESALAQTYPQVEVVVVDDGSRDNTSAVAGAYPGVRVVRQENAGLAAARNAGLRVTDGEFLVFLDADDRLLPHAVETGLAELAKDTRAAFAAGHYRHIDANGEAAPGPRLERVESDPYAALLRVNWTGMPATCVFRREPLVAAGGFDRGVGGAEDYDACLRLAGRHPAASHDVVVAEYRRHGRSMTGDPARMLRAVMRAHAREARTPAGRRCRSSVLAGRRFWRTYYGDPLGQAVRTAAREHRWADALRGAAVLGRHHPAGLLRLPLGTRT
ncbi:MAG: hypothetical protein QOD86_2183 [Miltoncostaeaceae bacterium]|jgi:hypothetical protein|nr:hypothetical protein [Miltoncostaeaceae bacterium]